VDAAHAVLTGDLVGLLEKIDGSQALAVDADWVAVLEADDDFLRLIGGLLGGYGHAPHAGGWARPAVLQDAAVVTDVAEASVHGVRVLLGHRQFHAGGGGGVDGVLAAVQVPLAPRGYDLDVGLERVGGKLEPHLVVALAGGAVSDSVGAFGPGYLGH